MDFKYFPNQGSPHLQCLGRGSLTAVRGYNSDKAGCVVSKLNKCEQAVNPCSAAQITPSQQDFIYSSGSSLSKQPPTSHANARAWAGAPRTRRGGQGVRAKRGSSTARASSFLLLTAGEKPPLPCYHKNNPALIITMRGSHPDFTANETKERKKEGRVFLSRV